jgi:hypothetical protein
LWSICESEQFSMAFSIWEYLRERARNATLAGIQDALDIAEDGDFESGQKAAADRLTARLSGQALVVLPEPVNVTTGQRGAEEAAIPSPPPVQGRNFGQGLEPKAPTQTPDPFADRLSGPLPSPGQPRLAEPQERRGPSRNGRLDGQAPPLSEPPPAPKPESPERRKRGRPRKDEG